MQNEITELRNQVRTLKRIVYGFGCLLVAGIVVGATSLQTVPDVIQAKKFEVVNGDGKTIAQLSGDSQGGGLFIFNKRGSAVVGITANSNGGGLGIMNNDGRMVADIDVTKDGGVISTANNEGETTSSLP